MNDEKILGADAAAVENAGSIERDAASHAAPSHTPGPWLAFYKPKYNEWHVSLPCEDSTMRVALCSDGIPGSTVEECAANAHLIAAAPELKDACDEALWLLRLVRDAQPDAWLKVLALKTVRHKTPADVWDQLKSALAKAEGRS